MGKSLYTRNTRKSILGRGNRMNKDYVIQKKHTQWLQRMCEEEDDENEAGNRRTSKKRAFNFPRHGREFVFYYKYKEYSKVLQIEII